VDAQSIEDKIVIEERLPPRIFSGFHLIRASALKSSSYGTAKKARLMN